MDKIEVLIVDDQELFAAGLDILIRGYGKESISVIGIASNGHQAVEMTEKLKPHVILMDVRMPVMDGVMATKIIHDRYPDIKILILTTFDDDRYVFDALNNGAQGYILKKIQPEELMMSIKTVFAGNLLMSPSVGRKLVRHAHERMQMTAGTETNYQGEINFLLSHFETLSAREGEVLNLMLQDSNNREIAEKLFIAEQTVRNHISTIYKKLGVADRAHAVKKVKKTFLGRYR